MRPGRISLILLIICCYGCARAPEARHAWPAAQDELPAAAFLAALPDGIQKQQFIVDCTGCHTFHAGIAYPDGKSRTRPSWENAIGSMIARFGPRSGFPVIGPTADPSRMSEWLTRSLPDRAQITWKWQPALEGKAEIREYPLPEATDLPHDLVVDGNAVVVTGMFSAQLYRLDPTTGAVRTEPTPQPNPRAIERDTAGNLWVVLGGPQLVARRTPANEWHIYDTGYYAHSVALSPDGGVWVNGHFTHKPELISRIDPRSAQRKDYTVPAHPSLNTTTVPYEIRAAADGMIWLSELQGNRLVRFDPRMQQALPGSLRSSPQFKVWNLPTAASGPRRLDVDPTGVVWIPEYGANKLARFDPRTEKFEEFELPLKDTAPYIARWDARRGVVWVGSGMADAVFRFDPNTKQFRYYRLPTPDAMIRHIAFDPSNGDVWLAPGSSPGTTPARVVRLRPND
jgi:streptogramin lyase